MNELVDELKETERTVAVRGGPGDSLWTRWVSKSLPLSYHFVWTVAASLKPHWLDCSPCHPSPSSSPFTHAVDNNSLICEREKKNEFTHTGMVENRHINMLLNSTFEYKVLCNFCDSLRYLHVIKVCLGGAKGLLR